MKLQILDIAERSKWDDEVLGHWEEDFRWLEELQGRGVTTFNGFWPTTTGSKEELRREIVSFYNIVESDYVEDVSEEFDRLIEIASQKERYRLLADKEEELMVSSLLLFFTCSGSNKSLPEKPFNLFLNTLYCRHLFRMHVHFEISLLHIRGTSE